MTPDLLHPKTTRRHLEHIYCSTNSPLEFKNLRLAANKYHTIFLSRQSLLTIQLLFSLLFPILVYYGRRLTGSFTAILSFYKIPLLTSSTVCYILLRQFSISTSTFSPPFQPLLYISPTSIPPDFPTFTPASVNEICTLISQCLLTVTFILSHFLIAVHLQLLQLFSPLLIFHFLLDPFLLS